MPPTAQSLLNAQIAFLDQELQGDRLQAHLEVEAKGYCELLQSIAVRDLLPPAMVVGWVQRNLLGYAPTDSMRQQVVMLIEIGLDNASTQQVPIRDLINRQIYDMMVERLISRPALRQELIEMVLHNPASHRMLSELMYRNIIGYLTTNNPVAKHVPGAASLIKLGSGVISRMGNVERTLEKSVKAYIRHTLRDTASLGVEMIVAALNNQQLRSYADEFWPRLANYRFGDASRHLELEGYSYLAVVFWNMVRTTEFMNEQVAHIINRWYDHKGDEMAMDLLEDIGITEEQIVREVIAVGTPVINTLRKRGHIKQRFEEHLQAFYETDAAKMILAPLESASE